MTENSYERARRLYQGGDYEEAFREYLRLASATEDPEVMAFVGKMHLRGQGTVRNDEEAARWYAMAADRGDVRAMLYLAGLHSRRGEHTRAKARLEAAAAQDYGPAFFFLGRMHGLGRGVPRDQLQARRYFELAAQQGHVWARKEIALRMMKGEYGLSLIPRGLVEFVGAVVAGVKIGRVDPDDDRIRV